MNRATRLRHWLKRKLSWVLVPVRGGPLKGAWFGLFTGSRFVRGTYGADEVATFERLVKPGDVVYDIGAHVGYFTMLVARLVGPRGRVFAFEPLPVNLAYLEQHRTVNRLRNVKVLPLAVGERPGQMSLCLQGGTGRGCLAADETGGLRVNVASLDALLLGGELPGPDFIKMDVEGAETEALRGALQLLARHRPVILLSVHGEPGDGSKAILTSLGYTLSQVDDESIIVASPPAAGSAIGDAA